MTFDQAPDVLTIAEAAKLARVGERQMREAVHRGEVYGARLGRSIRISKYALARWLEGQNGDGQAHRPRGGHHLSPPAPEPATHEELVELHRLLNHSQSVEVA